MPVLPSCWPRLGAVYLSLSWREETETVPHFDKRDPRYRWLADDTDSSPQGVLGNVVDTLLMQYFFVGRFYFKWIFYGRRVDISTFS